MTSVHAAVSVIVPVYDHAEFLGDALRSALDQTHPPAEVIVVDDGSTDDSGEVAGAFGAPVRVLSQAHGGASAARNRGLAAATGTHIAFLDADDLWESTKLEHQLAVAAAPDDVLVFGLVTEFLDPGLDAASSARIRKPAEDAVAILVSALLARADLVRRVGAFDERLTVGEWADWQLRANDLGLRSIVIPEVVMRRRLHAQNQGLREAGTRHQYLHVVKAALDRRRALERDGDPAANGAPPGRKPPDREPPDRAPSADDR